MSFNIINDYKISDTPHKISNETIDYGVKMIGASLEWPETEGEGIKIGIIDTGIDLYHEDLVGRTAEYYNFTNSNPKDITDENGHGTHVAGIIAANRNKIGVVGVAPKCTLYIAKAFSKDGDGDNINISNALKWLMSKNVNIINMSFTTKNYNSDFEYYIKKCYSQGIICVCAAGNSGKNSDIEYPARFPETISVTAVDINKNITNFSSRGERADIAAPGNNILSTFPNNMYTTLSGTSMAAPLITGAVALLQGKALKRFGRFLKPNEVSLIMDIYADDLGTKGKDNSYGYGLFSFGRIERSEYINSTSSTPKVNSPTQTSTISSIVSEDSQSDFKIDNNLAINVLILKLLGLEL